MTSSKWLIVTDACPWGIGGVLVHQGLAAPVAFFAKSVSEQEVHMLGLPYGDASQGACEAVALLCAVRLWSRFLATSRASVRARSDSYTALSLLTKMSSNSGVLNFVGAHLAIELEAASVDLYPEFILGKWNEVADSLSRKFAPGVEGKWSVPVILHNAKEIQKPRPLDTSYWLLPCPIVYPQLWNGAAAECDKAACLEGLWNDLA